MSTDGNTSNERPLPAITITGQKLDYNLISSKDIDPEMGTVLAWHIKLCGYCFYASQGQPLKFGSPATQFCHEYWEIIAEYGEYERHYAFKGNP